jgi:hypothetical protein
MSDTSIIPPIIQQDLPNILIVGPSGSGKTTCFRNLNPEKWAILNHERKALPFKGAGKFKYHKMVDKQSDVVMELTMGVGINPAIEGIVIDSLQSLDEDILSTCRTQYKGYDIFTNHNKMVRDLINNTKILGQAGKKNPPKFIVFTALDEIVNIAQPSGNSKATRRAKVDGKELTGTIEKEFTIVLFTEAVEIQVGNQAKIEYKFMTNTDTITSAKTPMGMYNTKYIDNDLAKVIEDIKKYYEIK